MNDALVAQLDRALPSEGKGWWFESTRGRFGPGFTEFADPIPISMRIGGIELILPSVRGLYPIRIEIAPWIFQVVGKMFWKS